MVEIPTELQSLFRSEVITQRGGNYLLEVPKQEIETGALEPGEVYQIAVLNNTDGSSEEEKPAERSDSEQARSPPVEEGEIRKVEIVSTGKQGDGIAKVERGFVLIVEGATEGETVSVKVDEVREDFAYASVSEESHQLPS